ncbi:Bcr/CflA family efflux MFS transporter [Actinoplanes auranticolor]|uniref:Bcr/CflA family drug resistance efflux transporter n=1 Tax=Actinoplanes auranticolor TaxID=47988 RepID=A0A919SUW5_9ACTN|nr:Bcr/CflA family efflux MFS transporter [Actinoplanes auranticolor]GIM78419.1 Bcr/CflA family drug resistance efflux transporter [Actinoplanes auranticolor]
MTALPVLVLGLLAALGPLSIDLYLPAFPALRQDLHTSDAAVQFTLAGMTLGLALGQAVVGAWSDRVGRRTPLLLSTVLHLLATIGCALAPSVEVLAACRFVQGVGAAGSAVLVLAIVRDVADGRALVVLLSRVTLVETVAPLLAPVAGAELLPLVGWRGIFDVLAAGSALLLVAALLVVPETARRPPEPVRLRARLRAVTVDRDFRLATVSGSMTFAGVYAYVAASPALLQEVYGLSPRAYAVVFLLNSLGLVAGVQLSSVLARRARPAQVLAGCTAVTLVAAAAIVPLQWTNAGLPGLLPCLWLFVAGCGGCFATAAGLALHGQGAQSGTATSVYGFATFAAAGLVSPLAGLAGITDATPVAVVLLATSAVSLAAGGMLLRAGAAQATSVAVPPVTRSSSA